MKKANVCFSSGFVCICSNDAFSCLHKHHFKQMIYNMLLSKRFFFCNDKLSQVISFLSKKECTDKKKLLTGD